MQKAFQRSFVVSVVHHGRSMFIFNRGEATKKDLLKCQTVKGWKDCLEKIKHKPQSTHISGILVALCVQWQYKPLSVLPCLEPHSPHLHFSTCTIMKAVFCRAYPTHNPVNTLNTFFFCLLHLLV